MIYRRCRLLSFNGGRCNGIRDDVYGEGCAVSGAIAIGYGDGQNQLKARLNIGGGDHNEIAALLGAGDNPPLRCLTIRCCLGQNFVASVLEGGGSTGGDGAFIP